MGGRANLHTMHKIMLNDKVIIVSGATRGLGLIMAHAFAKHGAFVVASGSRQSAALEAAAIEFGGRAIFLEANVTNPNSASDVVGEAL